MMKNRQILTPLLLLVAAGAFLLLFSTNTSPLFDGDWGDYSIYKYLGLGILEGKLPYLDLFDNKGPLLYALNAVGMALPALGRWGLYGLQCLCMAFSLWMIHKSIRLFVSERKAWVSTLVALLLLGGLYQGGDHVEEWMLPLLCSCMYLTLRLCQDYNRKNLYRLAVVGGLSLGGMMLLRLNDAAALGLGTALAVLLLAHQHRGEAHAWHNILIACAIVVAGVVIVLLPVIIVYMQHDGLQYLWQGMVGANKEMNSGWVGQWHSLLRWGKWAIGLLLVTLCVMAHNVDKRLNLCLIPIGLAQLFFVGGKLYAHYLIVFFPLLGMYIGLLWRQRSRQVVVLALAVLLLSHRPLPRMMALNAAACIHGMGHKADAGSGPKYLLDMIPDGAMVWNYNLDPYNCELTSLVENRIVQCNRLVDHWHFLYVEEDDFQTLQPQFVLATGDAFERDTILCAHYSLLGQCHHGSNLRLYMLNIIE